MDTQLVEKIVHEVKSQGVFDEFRKDSMADVDTKPAYQNLRQRVENTVKKFLSEQKWTPETNKNQLREKLRRHITESGFLDVGVERIVDQVVNPKIGSVFQPRIEEIAYKYLGLPPPPKKFEPPPPPLMHPLPPLPLNAPPLKVETCSLLPTDLEQVSPDSDKGTVKSEGKDDRTTVDMDTEEKIMEDEEESPPFEPLVKQEVEDTKELVKLETKDEKPNIKQECEESFDAKTNKFEESNDTELKTENMVNDNDSQETSNFATESAAVDKDASQSVDARISQDSQLSSVSSDSRLSVNGKEDSLQSSSQEAVAANISEEAQMPKFNENSSEPNASTNGHANEKLSTKSELHFDIKKDEIKFEGTERKTGLEITETAAQKSEEEAYEATPTPDTKNDSFKFNTNKSNMESKEEDYERTPNAQELSFGSSIEDSSSVPPNQTPKDSTQEKEKEDLPQIQTPKQTIRPSTPNTTPIPTPPLPTPTATPSPVATQKPDKEHQSRHSSSSSSKHKKHSKERRRSYEREKEKDSRDRHRSSKDSKDSSRYHSSSSGNKSSSKHSSSSYSKYSSSHNKSTEKDIEKSSSSSTHSSSKHTKHSHSHSSSSSNENQDSKKSKRDSERRHHSSTSSSSKRSERKDDHAEAKHKTQRRKSTDSNDDEGDKSMGANKSSSQYKSSYSSSSQGKSSKSKSNGSEGNKTNDTQKDQLEVVETIEPTTSKTHHVNNVVILNDILENPQTQFIQLNNTGHLVETPVPQPEITITEMQQTVEAEFNNNIAPLESKQEKEKEEEEEHKELEKELNSLDLLYFDDGQQNLTERLKLLNATMDLCRSAVNSLRFDSLSDEGIELSNEEDVNSDSKSSNLLAESLKRKSDYNYAEFETTPRKRVMSQSSEGCQSKTSPTPSDTSSINSKENEDIVKNTSHAKKSLIERHKAAQKLSQQQRYSSEDLYKPRPILGQRSRRRGMDSLV